MKRDLWPVNWLLFFIGIAIVWLATHNWVAVLGAWVASIHIRIKIVAPPEKSS